MMLTKPIGGRAYMILPMGVFPVGEFSGPSISVSKIIINDGIYTYLHLTCKATIVLHLGAFFSSRFMFSSPKERRLPLGSSRRRHTEKTRTLSSSQLQDSPQPITFPSLALHTCSFLTFQNAELHLLGDLWIWKSSSYSQIEVVQSS